MYKKITHTIVEKHYSLPTTSKTKQKFYPYYDDEDIRPMATLTTADKFKNDIRAYFAQLQQRLTNIANATESGNMDALLTEETGFFDEVDSLGLLLRPYYGIEFNERLSQVFRGLGLSMIGIGRNAKFKTDSKFIISRLDENFVQLDNMLNQFNNNWELGSVRAIWIPIKDALISETIAIMNKDSAATATAHTQAANQLLSFADLLANSVIQQYPTKFIQ